VILCGHGEPPRQPAEQDNTERLAYDRGNSGGHWGKMSWKERNKAASVGER